MYFHESNASENTDYETRRSVEHCTPHPMATGYISLAYLIDFRMIKLYLLPICWQNGRGTLQQPISNGISVRQV